MDLTSYLQIKEKQEKEKPQYRTLCATCTQPNFSCYCHLIQPFESLINFVILIHPIEAKRRIATGRMSYLSIKDSHLIKGQDYTENNKVNDLIADKEYHSMILYPGRNSQNLSTMTMQQRQQISPSGKKLRLFVIDGTWATARKMVRQSTNISALPRICFSPTTPSSFRVRKQPHAACYSTIEAIHHTIELMKPAQSVTDTRPHDRLLKVFDYMVEKQLDFIRSSNLNLRESTYRREGQKKIA